MQKRVQTRLAARRRREAEEARVAAGIAAEEQRFEAIKQRFGLDAAGIIDALTLWQEHGHDIVARRQGHEAANGDAKGVICVSYHAPLNCQALLRWLAL